MFDVKLIKYLMLCMAVCVSVAHAAGAQDKQPAKTTSSASGTVLPFVAETSALPGYFALDVAGKKIDATFLDETLGQRHGAVLILPGQNEDIDSRGIVHRLRHGLLSAGWSTMTLSLDFPIKANIYSWPDANDKSTVSTEDKKTKQAADNKEIKQPVKPDEQAEKKLPPNAPPANQQRITAALAYLQSKGIKNIVLLGHGRGGVEAAQAVMQNAGSINALILVATPKLEQSLQTAQAKIAVVDFYGDLDRTNVLNAITNRKAFMHNQPESLYASRKIWGADHDFYGLEDQLLSAVRNWLRVHFVKKVDS